MMKRTRYRHYSHQKKKIEQKMHDRFLPDVDSRDIKVAKLYLLYSHWCLAGCTLRNRLRYPSCKMPARHFVHFRRVNYLGPRLLMPNIPFDTEAELCWFSGLLCHLSLLIHLHALGPGVGIIRYTIDPVLDLSTVMDLEGLQRALARLLGPNDTHTRVL